VTSNHTEQLEIFVFAKAEIAWRSYLCIEGRCTRLQQNARRGPKQKKARQRFALAAGPKGFT